MGARTPDAYRIGAGQVTQEYPADAVPARLRKQPSLPTMSHAPESSPAEQAVTAEVAAVRRKVSGAPRSSNDSRPSKDAAAVTQHQVAAREAAPAQAAPVVESPAREYAHLDEAGVAFEGDQHPGVPVHHDWRRTTMRVVDSAEAGHVGTGFARANTGRRGLWGWWCVACPACDTTLGCRCLAHGSP